MKSMFVLVVAAGLASASVAAAQTAATHTDNGSGTMSTARPGLTTSPADHSKPMKLHHTKMVSKMSATKKHGAGQPNGPSASGSGK